MSRSQNTTNVLCESPPEGVSRKILDGVMISVEQSYILAGMTPAKTDSNTGIAQEALIFDPIPRVDGTEPSDDPLLDPHAAVYLASGRRRRAG